MNREQVINYFTKVLEDYNSYVNKNNDIARNGAIPILNYMYERDNIHLDDDKFKSVVKLIGNEVITETRNTNYCSYEHKMYFTDQYYVFCINESPKFNA